MRREVGPSSAGGTIEQRRYEHLTSQISEIKRELNGMESGSQANVKPSWTAAAGDPAEILHKPGVAGVDGYGLSQRNFTDDDRTKLDSIDDNAHENVQVDWSENDASSHAYIKHKPTTMFTAELKTKLDAVAKEVALSDGIVTRNPLGRIFDFSTYSGSAVTQATISVGDPMPGSVSNTNLNVMGGVLIHGSDGLNVTHTAVIKSGLTVGVNPTDGTPSGDLLVYGDTDVGLLKADTIEVGADDGVAEIFALSENPGHSPGGTLYSSWDKKWAALRYKQSGSTYIPALRQSEHGDVWIEHPVNPVSTSSHTPTINIGATNWEAFSDNATHNLLGGEDWKVLSNLEVGPAKDGTAKTLTVNGSIITVDSTTTTTTTASQLAKLADIDTVAATINTRLTTIEDENLNTRLTAIETKTSDTTASQLAKLVGIDEIGAPTIHNRLQSLETAIDLVNDAWTTTSSDDMLKEKSDGVSHDEDDYVQQSIGRIGSGPTWSISKLRTDFGNLDHLISAMLNIAEAPRTTHVATGAGATLSVSPGSGDHKFEDDAFTVTVTPGFNRGSWVAAASADASGSPTSSSLKPYGPATVESVKMDGVNLSIPSTTITPSNGALASITKTFRAYVTSAAATETVYDNKGDAVSGTPFGVKDDWESSPVTVTYTITAPVYVGDSATTTSPNDASANSAQSDTSATSRMNAGTAVAYVPSHTYTDYVRFPRQPTEVRQWNALTQSWFSNSIAASLWSVSSASQDLGSGNLTYWTWQWSGGARDPADLKFSF